MQKALKHHHRFNPKSLSRSRQRKLRWLREYMEVTGLNAGELAQLVGCARQTMYGFVQGKTDVYLATWEDIERFLVKSGMRLE